MALFRGDATQLPRPPLCATGRPAKAVAFSADGRYFAVGLPERRVQLGESRSGKLLRVLDGGSRRLTPMPLKTPDTGIRFVAFSDTGPYLFAEADDGSAMVWDWQAGSTVYKAFRQASSLVGIRVSPQGIYWADSQAQLWAQIDQQDPEKIIEAPCLPWGRVLFDPQQPILYAQTVPEQREGHFGFEVQTWNTGSGVQTDSQWHLCEDVGWAGYLDRSMQPTPDPTREWHNQDGVLTCNGVTLPVGGYVKWITTCDGRRVITYRDYPEPDLRLWDATNGRLLKSVPGVPGRSNPYGMDLHPESGDLLLFWGGPEIREIYSLEYDALELKETRAWPFERPPVALGFGYWMGINTESASVLIRDDGSRPASFDLGFWGRYGGDLDGSEPLWHKHESRLGIACAAGWLLWNLEKGQEIASRSWYPAELQVDGSFRVWNCVGGPYSYCSHAYHLLPLDRPIEPFSLGVGFHEHDGQFWQVRGEVVPYSE